MIAKVTQLMKDNEGLWTDQCCINQDDPAEKAAAIGAMDIIYHSSTKVFVIIQDMSLSNDEWKLFMSATDPGNGRSSHMNDDTMGLSQLFIRFMKTRNLQRAWCLHEVQLAFAQTFLVCVDDSIQHFDIGRIHTLFTLTIELISQHSALVSEYERVFLTYSNVNESTLYTSPTDHLLARFGNITELACSVITDKVSICLNVANVPLIFHGTAISADHCRWILGMVALAAGDSTILCGVGPSLELDVSASRTSWLRWSRFRVMDKNFQPATDLSSIKELDMQHVNLVVLDLSHSAVLRRPERKLLTVSEAAIEGLATSLESKQVQDLLIRMQLHSANARRPQQLTFLANIVACVLNCGLGWMYNQYDLYQRLPDSQNNPVQEYHSFEICVKFLLTESGLVKSFNMARYDLQPLAGLLFAILARSRLFFERLEAVEGVSYLDHCCCLSIGGKETLAMISPESVRGYMVVLPKILSGGDTCVQRRLWVLRFLDDVFVIVYKTPLFSFETILGEPVVSEREIRLVGAQRG